eukprot:m51a1_g3802 putative phosphatidic acid phosphohydrolase 2 (314) ;mRNA; r:214326-215447
MATGGGGASDLVVTQADDGALASTPLSFSFPRLGLRLDDGALLASLCVNGAPTAVCVPVRGHDDPSHAAGPVALSPSDLDAMALQPGKNRASLRLVRLESEGVEGSSWQLRGIRDKIAQRALGPDIEFSAWLWPRGPQTRVVVSDIDGTITRSDVRGHLLGSAWARPGVADLYRTIASRGYLLVYLSARPASQAQATRELLCGCGVPDGPLFLSDQGTVASLVREVARPEELRGFKAGLLRGLAEVAGCGVQAGLGNRATDVDCYADAGVPRSRIVVAGPEGTYSLADGTPVQSYAHLRSSPALLDSVFPSLQ